MAISTITWKDYLKQSQSEKEACLLLYDKGHYGLSAYLMQQALEKRVKSFILHYKLSKRHIRTHLPLIFIEDILPANRRLEQVANKYGIEMSEKLIQENELLIEQSDKMMKILDGRGSPDKDAFKITFWKKSLGIELSQKEWSILNEASFFKEYYPIHSTKILGSNFDNEQGKDFIQEAKNDPQIREMGLYWTAASIAPMIVATFPHEDFGRYPTEVIVNDKSEKSSDLYEKHKTKLKEMIDIVLKQIPETSA